MVHPQGQSFTLRHDLAEGGAHANRALIVSLPRGSASHTADVAIELENGAVLYVDILDAHARPNDIKAGSFDALHFKKGVRKAYSILVFIRSTPGLHQEVAESIGHGYDRVFGVDEEGVAIGAKYAALRQEIAARIKHFADA